MTEAMIIPFHVSPLLEVVNAVALTKKTCNHILTLTQWNITSTTRISDFNQLKSVEEAAVSGKDTSVWAAVGVAVSENDVMGGRHLARSRPWVVHFRRVRVMRVFIRTNIWIYKG